MLTPADLQLIEQLADAELVELEPLTNPTAAARKAQLRALLAAVRHFLTSTGRSTNA